MKKVYVGCSLTHAPEAFRREVERFKKRLKEIPDILVLEFLRLKDGTARAVYTHDIINCVGHCDLMIAICDHPSTGLGWEMGIQVSRGKPLLAFGHCDDNITMLILDPGIPGYEFHRYQTFDEIYETVREKL